jgi:hypothetical protein
MKRKHAVFGIVLSDSRENSSSPEFLCCELREREVVRF